MITGEQAMTARKLVGWTRRRIAVRAGVSESTVGNFEAGRHRPADNRVLAIKFALERLGVEFLNSGPGVKLKAKVARAPSATNGERRKGHDLKGWLNHARGVIADAGLIDAR
jgi:transcriptional regulator with XRE-family HTH domain